MECKDVFTPMLAIGGIVIGWVLSELSSRWGSKRAWSQRLKELKIENYTEWASGMEANLVAYATQTEGSRSEYKTPLCEKRLLLLESNPKLRTLIEEVHKSIPDYGTEDFRELEMKAHGSPDWDWPPFRKKMDDLLDRVRKSLFPSRKLAPRCT
jgi:hypothetical protein